MSNEVQFSIKLIVDGKEKVVNATASVSDMQRAVEATRTHMDKLRDSLVTFNQKVDKIRNVSNAISDIAKAATEASSKIRGMQASLAQAAQLTGLQGDELKAVRSRAQAVADVFDGDVSEVMQAANSLAKSFGTSVTDAMQLLQDGMVGGANANGEFIDTLREYPRYFKEAGISAEEFVAITTNAAKQGIFSDKGVDAIKEGNLRIREMTEATANALEGIGISSEQVQRGLQDGSLTTFKVMQMVSDKLKELPASSAVVGTAIADIFGGPGEDAGLEYLKSLADIELNMEKVKESADEYSKALGRQADMQTSTNNTFSVFQDILIAINDSVSGILPTLNAAIQTTANVGTAIFTLTQTTMALSKVQKIQAATQALCTSAATAWRTVANFVTGTNAALGVSEYGAAAGATALKMALRGLMICTGIGAVVAALTFGIEALMNALDDTEDAGGNAAKGLDASAAAAKRAQDAFESTSSQTFGNLMSRYAKLQAAWKALSDEHQKKAWIANNRSELEQLGLTINSTADAENAFVGNTDSVVESFKKKAKAAALMAQLTEEYNTQMRLADKIATANEQANARHKVKAGDEVKGSSHTTEGGYEEVGSDGKWRYTEKGAARNNAQTWYANGRQTKEWRKALQDSKDRTGRLEGQVDGLYASTPPTKATTNSPKTTTSTTKNPPKETPKPIDMSKLKFTPDTGGAGETMKTQFTESELENLSRYFEEQRSTVATTAEEYAEWTQKINAVDEALKNLRGDSKQEYTPASLSELNTLNDLDDAISYYGNLMQTQSSAEIEQTQRTIDALERKRDALQAIADIPQMQREVGEVSSKKGSRKRKALQGVDFDGRIEELGKMKMGGNLTDSQMKEIDALIDKYKELKRESALSFDTLQEGWGNIKGIGSAVSSISDALEGNADAWTTITSVVDGALQMYQSISGIVEIISALTGATAGQTAAEGAKTGVTATSTQTTMQDTLATQMNTQAAAENTAVKSGEAIVNATASGAKLGFPANIVAIAAGVAAVVAALSMIGSFSTGGIVGGNSPTGDKLMARVNSGEMILNRRQQQRLLDILSGKSMVSAAAQRVIQSGGNVPSIDGAALAALEPREPSINIHLKSRIRGNDITQSVANTSRIRGASGHRTNIKI